MKGFYLSEGEQAYHGDLTEIITSLRKVYQMGKRDVEDLASYGLIFGCGKYEGHQFVLVTDAYLKGVKK